MSPDAIVKLFVGGARVLKFVKLHAIVRAVRIRATKTIVQRLHMRVIHKMRDFALCLNTWSPENNTDDIGYISRDTATACRDLMSDLLDVPDQELHCCIKAFPNNGEHRGNILTWARSEPQDSHKDDKKLDSNHKIENNSVYASLMGRHDGKTDWKRPFSCFSCNDLISIGPKYQCSRNKWDEHYNSTIVFPMRYLDDPKQKIFQTIGFLCFYSKRKNVFTGVPNIYKFVDNFDGYHVALQESTVIQTGACMADILSTFIRPTYVKDKLGKRKLTKKEEG